MAAEEPPDKAATREVEHVCVVKKSLGAALNPDLEPWQRDRFLHLVDRYTELASKLCRRASLVFLHYLIRRHEQGLPPPDLEAAKDAYWRQWLRVGLVGWRGNMPGADVAPYYEEVKHLVAQSVAELLRRPEGEAACAVDSEEGEDGDCDEEDGEGGAAAGVPFAFDQVLAHAATTFKTAVLNNLTVHFWDKLRRLCKHVAKREVGSREEEEDEEVEGEEEEDGPQAADKPSKPSAWTLMQAVRRDKVPDGWPAPLLQFVREVRAQLGVPAEQVLYDDTPLPAARRLSFAWWLQGQLAELEQRRNMLSPVFKVSRQHVRLDPTTLYRLARHCLTPAAPLPRPPVQLDDPAEARDAAKRHREAVAATKQGPEYQRYEEQMRKLAAVCPPYRTLKASLCGEHPDRTWLQAVPQVGNKPAGTSAKAWQEERLRRKAARDAALLHNRTAKQSQEYKDAVKAYLERCSSPTSLLQKFEKKPQRVAGCSDERWEAVQQEYKERCAAVRAANAAIRQSEQYKAREALYGEYERRVALGASLLFRPFVDKSAWAGWQPCMSVATDGVSVSIGYSRLEERALEGGVHRDNKARKAAARAAAARRHEEDDPFVDYDPAALTSTVVGDVLVVGLDPGRVQIVTALCVDSKGKKHVWKLSRGQFYAESGVRKEQARQAGRYAPLAPAFQALADSKGTLRARDSSELLAYMRALRPVEDAWWQVALRPVESRGKLRRYAGKRRVLDRFFARLQREAQALEPGKRVTIAYGSAVHGMPSTGKGEVAAPVGDAYRACRRVCGPTTTTVATEDETNTTAVCWDAKQRYRAVYKGYEAGDAARQFFGSYNARAAAPVARPEHVQELLTAAAARKAKERLRRGGKLLPEGWRGYEEDEGEEKKKKTRYAMVRGLRFCPERRMYFDRDESSARTIAFLHCLRLQGSARPTLFRVQREAVPAGGGASQSQRTRKKRTDSAAAATCGRQTVPPAGEGHTAERARISLTDQ